MLRSGQLEGNSCFFQFLKSNTPGDMIEIETEDETYLTDLKSEVVDSHTICFQLIDESR